MNVLWVTNLDAPYRRPLWAALGRRVTLRVLLLDGALETDSRANRGGDWIPSVPADASYDQSVTRSLRIARGEARYYLPMARVRLRGVDVVLLGGWESPSYWLIALASIVRGASRVGFYESHVASARHDGGLVARARIFWFRHLQAVVAPGVASRDALIAMGVRPERIFTGFNAVDVESVAASASAHRTDGAGHRYLYVGQLIERKNVRALIRAFARIRNEPDTLTVIGVGDQEAALRELVTEAGLDAVVRFAGYVPGDRIGEVLGSADTLVLPSLSEVWGLVVNEALAAGLQVVVSKTSGVAPSVAHMAGVVLADVDESSLSLAMEASRAHFSGPIAEPEILSHTPQRFAEVFLQALCFARSDSARLRRAGARIQASHRR